MIHCALAMVFIISVWLESQRVLKYSPDVFRSGEVASQRVLTPLS
jgi:hypothetical protein